jgi:predicted nucleic acid-binding Zn ribbon protein
MADAIRSVRRTTAPETLLGAVQEAWAESVGPAIAAEAEPVAERDGVVTVSCRTAAWAQELDLMQADILARLNAAIEGSWGASVTRLRVTADQARFYT